MIGAIEDGQLIAWVTTVIAAGLAAYFGAYLGKRAERRAIEETLDKVERRAADISEGARIRWSRRSEVCATLYGRLIKATREFRNYLSRNTTSTDAAVEQLCIRAKAFDDYFAENALFLPPDIKSHVQAVADQFVKVFNMTTILRPTDMGDIHSDPETRRVHYNTKEKCLERFKEDGELTKMISEIEDELRSALDLK